MIQDYFLTFGAVSGFFIMLPAIRNKRTALPLVTSLLTAFNLTMGAICGLTLGTWMSALVTFVNAGVWFFLAARRRA